MTKSIPMRLFQHPGFCLYIATCYTDFVILLNFDISKITLIDHANEFNAEYTSLVKCRKYDFSHEKSPILIREKANKMVAIFVLYKTGKIMVYLTGNTR